MNNSHQIMLAWTMYADDNNDYFPAQRLSLPNPFPGTAFYIVPMPKNLTATWGARDYG